MAGVAGALHAELGPDLCFLDSDAIELEELFPQRLARALEAARVIVVLATPGYFERWYCLREWMAALSPWTSAADPGVELLDHVVVAIGAPFSPEERQRFPPPIQQRNLPPTSNITAVARLVADRLASGPPTLGDRLEAAGVGRGVIDLFTAAAALPFVPQTTAGIAAFPKPLPRSLGERFAGRADEFWRLHDTLWTRRMGGATAKPQTVCLHAGGGYGKSQLAIEYVHRMGPRVYRDGLFWIDATQPLEDQLRGVLIALGELPAQAQSLSGPPLRAAVATRLPRNAGESVLVVVDNVPEPSSEQPARPLSDYCPSIDRVTCLITSRARRFDAEIAATIELGVVSPATAVFLLQRDLPVKTILNYSEWLEIAEWVGRLPLALDLLNKSIQGFALTPQELLDASRTTEVSPHLDELAALLQDEMPPGAMRGITQAFDRSLRALPESTRAFALLCCQLAQAPIPRELLLALAGNSGGDVQRLVHRSFLSVSRTSSDALEMHRIMSSFLRRASTDPGPMFEAIAASVGKVLDTVETTGDEALLGLLAPHVAHIAECLAPRSTPGLPLERSAALLERLTLLGARASAGGPLVFVVRGVRAALSAAGTATDPVARARLHLILARALYELGSRQSTTTLLAEAATANTAGVGLIDEITHPLEWARGRNQLGVILAEWGARESDDARLRVALEAYDDALRVRAREAKWLDWAGTQNNMGNALMDMAQRTSDPATVEKAIDAYREAIRIYERSTERERLADVRSNLGPALRVLAEFTGEAGHFAAAERELLAAWTVFPRHIQPNRWGSLANNIGLLRIVWGAHTSDIGRIRAGLNDLSASLTVRRRTKSLTADIATQSDFDWAMTRSNLGRGYTEAGKLEGSAAMLRRAIASLRMALKVRTRATLPLDWGTTTIHLARAYAALGRLQRSLTLLRCAADAYEAGMDEYNRDRFEQEWGRYQEELGDVLMEAASLGDARARSEAAAAYGRALEVLKGTPREALIAEKRKRTLE